MLNFLSQSNAKSVLGISLTPGLGLEAVLYDKHKNTVLKYSRRKVDYNFSVREIQDYVQFKTALSDLLDDLQVPDKTPAYLVLPNVYFDFVEIPATACSDVEIRTLITSKAEDFYIFKKEEPVSGWAEVYNTGSTGEKRFACASFQPSAVDEIRNIFNDAGLVLVGIESAYSATLRGLYLTGVADDIILEQSSWTVMLVNSNSFTLFNMLGNNFCDYSEVPLAIRSFSPEEAYEAIVSSASQFLSSGNSMRLYIVSQTDEICAETLKRQMQFDREIIAINSNKFSRQPVVNVLTATDHSAANALTCSAIGATCPNINDFRLTINIIADDPNASLGVYFTTDFLGKQIEVTQDLVTKICIMIIVASLVLFGGTAAVANCLNGIAQDKVASFNQEISNVDAMIEAERKKTEVAPEIDFTAIIDEIASQNVLTVSYYDSISSSLPKSIWLTKYFSKNGNRVAVKGIAESIVEIYEYYKNLRLVSPEADIKLTELKVVTQDTESDDAKHFAQLLIDRNADRLYSFEISNTEIEVAQVQRDKSGKPVDNENEIIPRMPVEQLSNQVKPVR